MLDIAIVVGCEYVEQLHKQFAHGVDALLGVLTFEFRERTPDNELGKCGRRVNSGHCFRFAVVTCLGRLAVGV